jgi:RNA polymerase sigma-70 factor, ECF subfamily
VGDATASLAAPPPGGLPAFVRLSSWPTLRSPAAGGATAVADAHDLAHDPYVRNLIRRKARQVVGKAGLTPDDVPDIEQEFFRRFLERLRRCRRQPARPHAFVTLAVNQSVRNYLRDRSARKRNGSAASLGVPVADGDGRSVDLAQTVAEHEQANRTGRHARPAEEASDLAQDVAAVLANLPARLRALAERLKAGDSITRAAEALGLPRTTANDQVRCLRQHFERAGLRDYF